MRSQLLVVDYRLLVIFAALWFLGYTDKQKKRPGGEIGRRTVFRWQHPKGCAGSNPVPGTIIFIFLQSAKGNVTVNVEPLVFHAIFLFS